MNEPRQIPMIDLKTQLENLRPEIDEAIDRVLSSTAFVFGPDIKALEEEFAAFCGASYGCAVGQRNRRAPHRPAGRTGSAPATRS